MRPTFLNSRCQSVCMNIDTHSLELVFALGLYPLARIKLLAGWSNPKFMEWTSICIWKSRCDITQSVKEKWKEYKKAKDRNTKSIGLVRLMASICSSRILMRYFYFPAIKGDARWRLLIISKYSSNTLILVLESRISSISGIYISFSNALKVQRAILRINRASQSYEVNSKISY
jgi:hypothetical protein